MMVRTRRCPKCDGSMTQGGIIHRDSSAGRLLNHWVEGPFARYPRWLGGAVKLKGKKPVEIETWRCNRCGYLESYASGGASDESLSSRWTGFRSPFS